VTRGFRPLVPLYAAAVRAKNLAYARGWSRPRSLQHPVISIGNLSVGGSGKTPLTIRLAQLLSRHGIAVDVLSRGYGRHARQTLRVDPAGSPDDYGDEPLLIAQQTQVPVYVASSRCAAGRLAESENAAPRLHLLDDGFQHRQLARNVDIVLLHRSDFTESLLPAGRLREPLTSLARAQILVLRTEDRDLEPQLRSRGLRQPIWSMARRLEVPAARQAIAFCAIARPDEFFSGLRSQGVTLAATRTWRDHHRFTSADIAELLELHRLHHADAFLTTEKDLVRLSPNPRQTLEAVAPLHAVRLTVRLADESTVIAQLFAMLPSPAQPRPR
jgi:tetraacyldisaccharide 4'-kinase